MELNNKEIIEVSFIISEIFESQYHSLKTILLRYGQVVGATNSDLSDAIVSNRAVGNVALADDD